jgi:DNA-directed RNA polymerase specialized sigma24 family protein
MSRPGAFLGQPGHPTTSDADGRVSRASTKGTSSMREASDTKKDYDIVVAMRRGEAAAFERYIERFHRILLDYARRAGVAASDRDEMVSELLDDVAIQLMTRSTPIPQNPRMYLLSALRHKLLNRKRGSERRRRAVSEAARAAYADGAHAGGAHAGGAFAGESAAGCSEDMRRASHGPGWEGAPLPRVLERLAGRLSEALRDDERQLLVAVAENIPQREIAEWLGVSYAVARKRLERLRARLTDVAMQYANTLEPDDARELQRFFHRCRARIGARAIAPAESGAITPRGVAAP